MINSMSDLYECLKKYCYKDEYYIASHNKKEFLNSLNEFIDKKVHERTIDLETKISIYEKLISNSNFKIIKEMLDGDSNE